MSCRGLFAAALVAVAVCGSAQAHDDLLVTKIDGGATTAMGAFEVDENIAELDTRVFEGIFVAGAGGNDYARDEPGANAPAGTNPLFDPGGDLESATALSSGEVVTIEIKTFNWAGGTDDLFYWDGTGAVDFQPITTVTPSLSASSAPAAADGSLDFHPDFELNGAPPAPEGVYLMAVTLTAGTAAESELGYIVWLADDSITNEIEAELAEGAIEAGTAFEFYEEAVEAVEQAFIPEPGTAVLSALGLGMLAARRRRSA